MRLDLATLFDAIAAAVPEREAVVWRDTRRTFGQTADRVRRLARVLEAHGLGPAGAPGDPWTSHHDHLALYLYNGPAYLEGIVGAHRARVAPFNVNYRYVDDELLYLFGDAKPKAILYHAAFAPVLERVLPSLAHRPLLLQVPDDSGNALLPDALDYEEALAAAPDGAPSAVPEADDLHILYTGGTTGMPKGVLWRIEDLIEGPLGLLRRDGSRYESVEEIVTVAAGRSAAKVLALPPMMHGSGTWTALAGWLSGATVLVPDTVDRFDPVTTLDLVEREGATRVPVVGDAFVRPLVAELERRPRDTSRIRHLINSGAAINPATKARLAELMPHTKIFDVVGSSESGLHITRFGAAETSFQATPGAAVASEDRTRLLPPGSAEMGWLAKGGSIPRGYLGDAAKTAATFVEIEGRRWVLPGDRAEHLADGTFAMHGRDSLTINTGGEKVFVEEVEAVVRAVPGVAEALVLGRASERWGTEIVAVVRLTAELTDDQLKAACADRLARYKIPKTFVRTDRELRLPNGKADYGTARTLLK
ncbi:AMP-binding protein [Actinocorallia sp. API 0066]|uniref:AMP-binding protein n=1 Tax=Actinocorallia sp. API 0066 TaxID=2896846 RepID=UPI001E611B49|nr:AMP-binding protein [Actinocorallia sp. API 0066]MCD0448348.1 AMP-binding protein [Actinocorallia sp. API 0066]